MFRCRSMLWLSVALVLGVGSTVPTGAEEPVNLTEEVRPGDSSRYRLSLRVKGRLWIHAAGSKEAIPLEAQARHEFVERILSVDQGRPGRAIRHYTQAHLKARVGSETSQRELSAEHRLILVEREGTVLRCLSPQGSLSREELELVAGHLPPLAVAGLLPGRPVQAGDSWTIDDGTAQALCLLDGITSNSLKGRWVSGDGRQVQFRVEGQTEGRDAGALVKIAVAAEGTFDLSSQRIVALTWTQQDERGEGPISPASNVEANLRWEREPLSSAPEELADAVLEALPTRSPDRLIYRDPRGEYHMEYGRNWHITGETDLHLILRLVDAGELVAQATITRWKGPGEPQAVNLGDFRAKTQAIAGWSEKRVWEESEEKRADGRKILRRLVEGEIDGKPVLQSFYHISEGPARQLVLSCVTRPEKRHRLAERDRELADAIRFGPPKATSAATGGP